MELKSHYSRNPGNIGTHIYIFPTILETLEIEASIIPMDLEMRAVGGGRAPQGLDSGELGLFSEHVPGIL